MMIDWRLSRPACFMTGLSLAEAVAGKSRCRNKAIAEAFQYMKVIEGWGTGLPRLYQRCKEMGLQIPKFEEAGDGIRVTVYRTPLSVRHEAQGFVKNGETTKETTKEKFDTGRDNVKELLKAAIRENPTITMKVLAIKTNLTVDGVKYHLNKMRQAGILSREGSTKAGKWIIHERSDV